MAGGTAQAGAGLKSIYLFVYNATLSVLWWYVLVLTYKTRRAGGTREDVWEAVELPLKIAQTSAVLEIVHSIVGIVRSPILVTTTQVASRLFILWGIINLVPFPTVTSSVVVLRVGDYALQLSFLTLLGAWGCSEVIRYSFFACKEQGLQPYPLLWLRYSAFLVLYPVGVASELTMVWLARSRLDDDELLATYLPYSWNFRFNYSLIVWAAVILYLPGFPQMFGYMLQQRRKMIGGYGRVLMRTKKEGSNGSAAHAHANHKHAGAANGKVTESPKKQKKAVEENVDPGKQKAA